MRICKAYFFLNIGQLDQAWQLIADIRDSCLEVIMLQANIFAASGHHREALNMLNPLWDRCQSNLRFCKQILQHQMDARDGTDITNKIALVLNNFGENPHILYHCTAFNLFKRQPGLARRSAILQQVWASIKTTPIIFGNQVNSYEGNGYSDWTEHLLPIVTSLPIETNSQLHSNLCMQLASCESRIYKQSVDSLIAKMSGMAEFSAFKNAHPGIPKKIHKSKKLKIGWISGDLDYHPVSRFLLANFACSKGSLVHEHEIISTQPPGPTSLIECFREDCGVSLHQLDGDFDESRVSFIRSLKYDIAIDLSGWTGGNFVAGFLARLAPIQVNYLGYFASTGLPTMDYWIGDNSLFPSPMSEWSSEKIYRLSRPFLAWYPVDPLPEANVDVTEPPSGPIRFGSFNHNRKLSDQTLKLWADVLERVPGSRLVLKASLSPILIHRGY